ncbi:hypothetical protein IQ06DRAFT_56968 [Phaeosphaeriaceae sp. SRC1lsM3a]|nr:hypothetical protein IQ06DRAFT_56968 [Stagonospora sp. SRC1lsM3a]
MECLGHYRFHARIGNLAHALRVKTGLLGMHIGMYRDAGRKIRTLVIDVELIQVDQYVLGRTRRTHAEACCMSTGTSSQCEYVSARFNRPCIPSTGYIYPRYHACGVETYARRAIPHFFHDDYLDAVRKLHTYLRGCQMNPSALHAGNLLLFLRNFGLVRPSRVLSIRGSSILKFCAPKEGNSHVSKFKVMTWRMEPR